MQPPRAELKLRLIRQHTPIGEGKRDLRLSEIQEQIGRGAYQVDTQAVAEAIVRKLVERVTGSERKRSQGECS